MVDAAGMPASDGALEQSGPQEPNVSKCGVRSKTECIMRAWPGAEASGQSSIEISPRQSLHGSIPCLGYSPGKSLQFGR
jgi:hypothetical protein